MSIKVDHLQDWIGSEARSVAGDKLGKIDDIYFAGERAIAIAIRSGLGGRKHHAAVLKGAGASRDGLNLAIGQADLVAIDGGPLTTIQLGALGAGDDRFLALAPEQVESWHQREALRQEADDASARAELLEAKASRLAVDEQAAATRASDAESAAADLRREHEDAESRARDARAIADRA